MSAAAFILGSLCWLIKCISWLTSFLLFNVTGFFFVVVIQIIRIPALWIQNILEDLSCLIKQQLQQALNLTVTKALCLLCQAWKYSVETANWLQIYVPELYGAILLYAHVLKDWLVETAPWMQQELVKLVCCGNDIARNNYNEAIDFIGTQLFPNTTNSTTSHC